MHTGRLGASARSSVGTRTSNAGLQRQANDKMNLVPAGPTWKLMVARVVGVHGPGPVIDGDDGACNGVVGDGDNGGGDDAGLHTR